MKKTFTQTLPAIAKFCNRNLKNFFFVCMLFCGLIMNAQVTTVLVPGTGSNSIPCGQTSLLQDANGSSNYQNNYNGYTVINAGFAAQITISGTCAVEVNYDYIRIYNGVGTGGTLLQTYNANPGTINYTGTAGQTLTVQFTSDGSVVYAGFDLNITFSGPCSNIPCTSTQGTNAVTTPTYPICPNSTAVLGLANSYSVGGLTFAWQSSTVSAVGPWTPVTGTNNVVSVPNQTISTYFSAVITCTNTATSYTTGASQVSVQPVVISTVPYLEDFEGIIANNKLPNCSWSANNIPSVTQTYINTMNANRVARSGTKFASFYMYYTNGSNYFYTNGIQLVAGITYSASLWYTTEYYGYTNATELAIMRGTAQSSTGLVTIASQSPAASPVYKSLSNTFTVPTSGIYYIAVKATGNGSYGTQYLSWDDLAITIPCSLNSSTVNVSVSSQTICKGQSVNLNATGADTYLWNTGATGQSINDMPNVSTLYSVVGTNTLTNCSTTIQTQMVVVNPSPIVNAYATIPVTCPGGITNLIATGANSYTWSTNSNNAFVVVSPTVTTSYIVLGENSFNCTTSATVTVLVNPAPVITVAGQNQICKGESATLNGGGALSYAWASNAVFIQAAQAVVNPMVTTTYTLTGTNANGCVGKTTYVLTVNDCVGINQVVATSGGVRIYPNPTSGMFTVELNTASVKSIQVTDVTGRIILTSTSSSEKINANISTLASGIYYVKIQSDDTVDVIKIVKH